MYENDLVLLWRPLYVCSQGASYPKLSSWQKSYFQRLRLGEHKKHKVYKGPCVEQGVKLFDAVKPECGLLFNRQNMMMPR